MKIYLTPQLSNRNDIMNKLEVQKRLISYGFEERDFSVFNGILEQD